MVLGPERRSEHVPSNYLWLQATWQSDSIWSFSPPHSLGQGGPALRPHRSCLPMTTNAQLFSQSATALGDRLAAPPGVDGPAEGAQARSSENARVSKDLVVTWPSPQASLRVLQFDEEPLPSRFALVLWQSVQLLWQSVQLLWQSVQLLWQSVRLLRW
jgi:hypothetical protein